MTVRHYARLAAIAEREAGLHMPAAKQQFVASRLQRCLRRTGIGDFDRYLGLIEGDDGAGRAERLQFISALTTNVTSPYREPHHFALLATEIAERAARRRDRPIAIWSAGCSTGEEPLSIAATCMRVLGRRWHRTVSILATDVDASVLTAARTRADAVDLGGCLLAGSGEAPIGGSERPVEPGLYCRELNRRIVYRRHNLLGAPPDGMFDVIFCRNVTIYFCRDAQVAAHAMLRSRLAPGGLLAIGHTEQLLGSMPAMVAAGRTAFRRAGGPILKQGHQPEERFDWP